MPAKSKAQQRFMGMMYSNPEMRKEAGISKETAKKFASTKHDKLPEKVEERMNYTEFCKYLDEQEEELTYEAKLPQCPPGYIWSRKRMDCIPKTERDKVSGRLRERDNANYNSASYTVRGRTGVNGDGYAYEDPPRTDMNAKNWSYSFGTDMQ